MSRMQNFIPDSVKDEVFFFADKVTHNKKDGGWTVSVNPQNCLVRHSDSDPEDIDIGPDVEEEKLPVISETRKRSVERNEKGDRSVYKGRILFSSGFVVMLDGCVVLSLRGSGATVDPGKWTSPAGRCDSTPSETALKELYEEILVMVDGKPAIIDVDGEVSSSGLGSVYIDTLRQNGIWSDTEDLVRLEGECGSIYESVSEEVKTEFGDERYTDEFWVFWDHDTSTLELRKVIELELPENACSISFSDAEYGQPTRIFTKDDLSELNASEMVKADRAFRDIIQKLG